MASKITKFFVPIIAKGASIGNNEGPKRKIAGSEVTKEEKLPPEVIEIESPGDKQVAIYPLFVVYSF